MNVNKGKREFFCRFHIYSNKDHTWQTKWYKISDRVGKRLFCWTVESTSNLCRSL